MASKIGPAGRRALRAMAADLDIEDPKFGPGVVDVDDVKPVYDLSQVANPFTVEQASGAGVLIEGVSSATREIIGSLDSDPAALLDDTLNVHRRIIALSIGITYTVGNPPTTGDEIQVRFILRDPVSGNLHQWCGTVDNGGLDVDVDVLTYPYGLGSVGQVNAEGTLMAPGGLLIPQGWGVFAFASLRASTGTLKNFPTGVTMSRAVACLRTPFPKIPPI